MSAPGYDDPPAYDQTSEHIEEMQNNIDPSAPPAYDDIDAPVNTEGTNTNNNALTEQLQRRLSQLPQRSIYIVKMPNEPTPIINVISPDLIPQYQSEHIVYPKSNNGVSSIETIQPNMLTSNTNYTTNMARKRPKQRATVMTELAIKQPTSEANNKAKYAYKAAPITSAWEDKKPVDTSRTMVAHKKDISGFQLCGANASVNYNKRTPTEVPNKYNLMYGRINLLIFIMLWITFGMIQAESERTLQLVKYCYTEYEDLSGVYSWSCDTTASDYMACNQDPVCRVMDDVYEEPDCYDEWDDCQCCANTGLDGGIQGVYIAFYVFLAINTFRLLILSFGIGMGSIQKSSRALSLYHTDAHTNMVQLQDYMNYLCDHPSSYLLGIFYSDAGKAMTEGIVHNISFPQTRFLYLNIVLLYIPFFTLIGIITSAQITFVDNASPETVIISTPSPTDSIYPTYPTYYPTYPTYSPTPYPTYQSVPTTPRPTNYWETTTTTPAPVTYEIKSDLLITCIVGLVLLFIGFVSNIYRWRKKNIIERNNLRQIAESQDKQIVPGDEDSEQQVPCCGFKKIYHYKRVPSDTPRRLNLVFRWVNLIIFIHLWILFVIGMVEYGWWAGDGGACIAYIVFLCFNTMRLMGISLVAGIKHVDNEYNYIINEDTGKVQLRYFMDYLCDHPCGFIIGFLYPDVQRALNEGLLHNITFPEAPFLFANIIVFYLPILIISSIQASHEYVIMLEDLAVLYTIAAILCGMGIISNAYRFKMKNDVETANANS